MVYFSIIIPIYNSGYSIVSCLDKIASQSFTDYEVVIVNDGSKDNTLEVINNYANSHSEINFNIITQKNAGAGAARNTGIDAAKGNYIVFVDADDYVNDDYLYLVSETIQKDGADVVFIDAIRENRSGKLLRKEPMSVFSNLSKEAMIRWQLTGKLPWAGWRKVVKTSIIRDNNIKYAPIKVGEESIFSFLILQKAERISFQPKAIYHYVESETSLTSHDTVSNSEKVFPYMTNYMRDNGYADKYEKTIRAMAITTVAIGLNVISQEGISGRRFNQMKQLIRKYKPFFKGEIDMESLDDRVRFCSPWIKIGCPIPVIIASKIQRIYKTIFGGFKK